jgi:hypothetical protein
MPGLLRPLGHTAPFLPAVLTAGKTASRPDFQLYSILVRCQAFVVHCGTRLQLPQSVSPENDIVQSMETMLYNGQWELDIVETLLYNLARLVYASVCPSSQEEAYGDQFLMRGTALGSRSLTL